MTGWSGNCEVGQVSNDISVLEQTIHTHQTLYEAMCQAYTEVSVTRHEDVTRMSRADLVTIVLQVHSTSKKLLYQLDHLVQLTNAAPNESPQKKHVSMEVVHNFVVFKYLQSCK